MAETASSAPPVTQAAPARAARFPCVGIALLYSAREDRGQAGLGALLHRAATHDMSLRGLSFDLDAPLPTGGTLMVLVGQPQGDACEQLQTTVRWCRQLGPAHYRVGVRIEHSQPAPLPAPAALAVALDYPRQRGQPVPASIELACPACGAHSIFELVAQQPVAGRAGLMPLYDCSACETTRGILGLLSHARQSGARAPADPTALEVGGARLPLPPPSESAGGPVMTLKRILYAEDEPDIQAVAKLALEMVGGYQVMICGNGVEALKQVTEFAPDMILLDVMMPAMDGPSTLKHLRANPATAGIPVVFLTAKVQPAEVAQYQSLGALDVIAKPFDPMTLAAQVRALWDRFHG